MVLIRILVLEALTKNVRIFAKHVMGQKNYFSDALSRLNFEKFWQLASEHNKLFRGNPYRPTGCFVSDEETVA